MNKRLFWLLFIPSVSSGVVALLAAVVIIGVSSWLYINHNQLMYDYLFGPYGITTYILRQPDSLSVLRSWVLGSAATYYILLAFTALMAGLTVFAVLQAIRSVWHGLRTAQSHKAEVRSIFLRLALRITVFVVWGLYFIFFVTIFVPFVAIILHQGLDVLSDSTTKGVPYIAASFVALLAGLHIQIIFARLIMLRPRLFGVSDVEIAESG